MPQNDNSVDLLGGLKLLKSFALIDLVLHVNASKNRTSLPGFLSFLFEYLTLMS
jgi:hypothetical protein